MKNGKKYGTHNSCTYAPLLGFQKLLYPFAVIFSRCQSKTLYAQFNKGVRLFDIQISKKHNTNAITPNIGGIRKNMPNQNSNFFSFAIAFSLLLISMYYKFYLKILTH